MLLCPQSVAYKSTGEKRSEFDFKNYERVGFNALREVTVQIGTEGQA